MKTDRLQSGSRIAACSALAVPADVLHQVIKKTRSSLFVLAKRKMILQNLKAPFLDLENVKSHL